MKKIAIVGFGRFGKTLYLLLRDDFEIILFDINQEVYEGVDLTKNTIRAKDIKEIYQAEAIFFAVPIIAFEKVIAKHKQYFRNHLLIDVLSVKQHPARVFRKYLKGTKTQALLTHPMFGPDSSKEGFAQLPLVMDKFMANNNQFTFWENYFSSKGLRVIEIPAKEHDRLAAQSQGVTHFIGRLLEEFKFKPTQIDTLGAKKLYEVMDQTCNDTWELFLNLQNYNFYTKKMRLRLGKAYDNLYNKLLPEQVNPPFITYGIQGGRGSNNDEAIQHYLKQALIKKNKQSLKFSQSSNYKIKYLYTSENVLSALNKGDIDRGQFAISNSEVGIVDESLKAMGKYKFKIIEQYAIKISHALIIRKDAKFSEVTKIMTHPQVLAQCKDTLARKYSRLQQTSGKDELIDQSMVAKYLSEKRLPKNIATIGNKVLAELYDLKVVEDNLQDARENYTSFLQVSRI